MTAIFVCSPWFDDCLCMISSVTVMFVVFVMGLVTVIPLRILKI
jgi:hypothetical protein